MLQLEGVTAKTNPGPKFGGTEEQPPIPNVTGKLRYGKPIMIEDFAFLKATTKKTAKFTIPSPSMLHLRAGRAGISKEVYPDIAEFWDDAAKAYAASIADFAQAGCTYLQLDDVSFAYLCDDKIRATSRKNGDDPDALPRTYADTITKALKGPAGRHDGHHAHLPRQLQERLGGRGRLRPGGRGDVLERRRRLLHGVRLGAPGGFGPLRYLPKGKKVVLGLVSSKTGALEKKDDIKRRIEEAAKFVPVENLCLSPQCGFSSTHHGNDLTPDEQWRKLELVVQIADEVW